MLPSFSGKDLLTLWPRFGERTCWDRYWDSHVCHTETVTRYHCHPGESVVKTWRVFARFQWRVTGWKETAWKGKRRKRGPGSGSGAGHPTYHVNLIKMKYEQAGYLIEAGYLTSALTTLPLDPGVVRLNVDTGYFLPRPGG